MATQTFFGTLTTVPCCDCGVTFGIEPAFDAARRNDHKTFYCPNGHSLSYHQESKAERLERELAAQRDLTAREKHWREQAEARVRDVRLEKEHVEHRLRGTKSVVTRMKRRTAAGRCPCCSHQFKDLEKHMKDRHPKWDPDRAAEAMGART
jgi:hypothetical protein